MKKTIVLILSSLLIIACSKQSEEQVSESKTETVPFPENIREVLEMCYFEGQRDALSGDVRIEEVGDHCYKWTSSPWDSGEEPIYKPCPDNN